METSLDDEKDSRRMVLASYWNRRVRYISYEDETRLHDVTLYPQEIAKGIKVSQELFDDGKHNVIKRMPLARSKIFTQEQSAADIQLRYRRWWRLRMEFPLVTETRYLTINQLADASVIQSNW
jgi:hypothetical protein